MFGTVSEALILGTFFMGLLKIFDVVLDSEQAEEAEAVEDERLRARRIDRRGAFHISRFLK